MAFKDAVCASCGKTPPKTNTNYTLVSPEYGWRLTRTTTPKGEVVVIWRCRECWKRWKEASSAGDASKDALGVPPARKGPWD